MNVLHFSFPQTLSVSLNKGLCFTDGHLRPQFFSQVLHECIFSLCSVSSGTQSFSHTNDIFQSFLHSFAFFSFSPLSPEAPTVVHKDPREQEENPQEFTIFRQHTHTHKHTHTHAHTCPAVITSVVCVHACYVRVCGGDKRE